MTAYKVGDTIKLRSGVFSPRNTYDDYGREVVTTATVVKVMGTSEDDGGNMMYQISLGGDSDLPLVVLDRDIV